MSSFAGAVIFPEQKETILFKNRDMTSIGHKDELFYDVDCFGVRGVDAVTGAVGGLAIGVNHYGLAIANTHVRNTDDPSYHLLTEQLLMFAKDAEDGLSMVQDHLNSDRKYQYGNLVLADDDSMLVIELAGSEHSIEWSERKVLRTSHHIMLDTEEVLRRDSTEAFNHSVQRVERGYELIRQVKSISGVFELLKDHGSAPGQNSLCKHSIGGGEPETVASYVVEVDRSGGSSKPRIQFHVAKGKPCETSYLSIPIVFPADDEVIEKAFQFYNAE